MFLGRAAGPLYNKPGGGSNFLCLHEDPQWKNYFVGHQSYTAAIGGAEYDFFPNYNVFSEINNGGRPLFNNPASCAVCYVPHRSTILMIPARTQCPDGWSKEYGGYLVAESSVNDGSLRRRSSYICVDEAPEVAAGNVEQNHAVMYTVEVHCGSLPCSVYLHERELTCVVCSK